MGYSVKFGSFNTGTAAAGNTVAITGVGFQPKQIFMWWVGRTETTDAVGRANTLLGFGAANSPTERYCTTQYSLDAAATSDGGLLASSTACVQTCDGAGASTGALDHQSMDAGGFTLVVDVQFSASIRVHYLALGGTDLTNYKLGTMTAPTSTGNLAYTGVGFQPDLVLMFINGINGGIGGSSSRQPIHIGAAKSSSSRWTASAGQDDGSGTMDAWSYANDIECIGIINAVGGATPEAQADFVSMDADGFTLNWTRVFASTARGGWYLALKGGQYALGSVLTQTDTTTDIVVSGLGFSPVGGLVVSHNQAESAINTATANANMSIGGFDSATSRGAVAYMDQNGLADSEVTTAIEHDAVYINVDDGARVALMDVKSVDSGGVTFIMDDADPAQYFAPYLLFGSTAAAGWTNIAKVDGIASASIGKVDGVAVASISKINGIAV